MPLSLYTPTAQKRHVFDQYGEEGLKRGGGDAGGFSGYSFSGDPHTIFSQFFGGANPFGDMFGGAGFAGFPRSSSDSPGASRFTFSSGGSGMGGLFGGPSGGFDSMDFTPSGGFGTSNRQQDSPIIHDLNCTLEELYQGCTKKMKISRKVVSADGTSSVQHKVVEIDVKPGWKEGTKITYPQEGDQVVGRIPADVVFKVQEKPHAVFKRDGNNLKYRAKITLKQALCGVKTKIPFIDKRLTTIEIKKIVNPETVHVIPGEGMPITKQHGRHGDLIVNFDIGFPASLSADSLQKLQKILP